MLGDELTRLTAHEMADRLRLERGPGHVVAQDVLELDRLGGRRDVVRVQLGELGVLVEDVVELPLEAGELVLGQPEAGEVGDVLDVGAGEAGHGAMIRGRAAAPDAIRVAPGYLVVSLYWFEALFFHQSW